MGSTGCPPPRELPRLEEIIDGGGEVAGSALEIGEDSPMIETSDRFDGGLRLRVHADARGRRILVVSAFVHHCTDVRHTHK
jgi:hypothetical protein